MSIKRDLVIYWSEADQAFVVKAPEFPGCLAKCETYEQAVANAQTVIQAWIDAAHAVDRPIPESSGRLIYA